MVLHMNYDEKVLKKLDILIQVSAVSAIQGKSLKEQVNILFLAGLRPKDIAKFLRKKPNHISVILNDLRKEKN